MRFAVCFLIIYNGFIFIVLAMNHDLKEIHGREGHTAYGQQKPYFSQQRYKY